MKSLSLYLDGSDTLIELEDNDTDVVTLTVTEYDTDPEKSTLGNVTLKPIQKVETYLNADEVQGFIDALKFIKPREG